MAKLQNNKLPYLRNVQAGNNMYDPQHNSIFEVYFSCPAAITGVSANDVLILTEQITRVTGLDALQKSPALNSQKFYGVDVSFVNPVHDNTYAEMTIEFNLNIRNVTDAYVLRTIKEWVKINYDMSSGTRHFKKNYVAPFIIVNMANRDGSIFRTVKFEQVMLGTVTGLDELDYTSNEPQKLTCQFRSDIWDDTLEKGIVS